MDTTFILINYLNLATYVASTSTSAMACDRYMSCDHPFRYRVLVSRKLITLVGLILLLWLLCCGFMIFEVFFESLAVFFRCAIAFCVLLSAAILYATVACVSRINSRYGAFIGNSEQNRTSTSFERETFSYNDVVGLNHYNNVVSSKKNISESIIGVWYIVNEHWKRDLYYHVSWSRCLFWTFQLNHWCMHGVWKTTEKRFDVVKCSIFVYRDWNAYRHDSWWLWTNYVIRRQCFGVVW